MNLFRQRDCSMIQGRLEVSTRPLRTGPAMPKQATSGRVVEPFRNSETMSPNSLYSRLGNTRSETKEDRHSGVENRPVERWFHQYRRPESFLEVPPAPAVALQQFIGLFRSPGAGSIIRKVPRGKRLPKIQHRIDHVQPASTMSAR
jgi:hypothetical protein